MTRRLLGAALVTLALSACGGGSLVAAPVTVTHPAAQAPSASASVALAGDLRAVSLDRSSTVTVRATPGGRVTAHIAPKTTLGSIRVFRILAQQGDWLKVSLPTRPNGSAGWVRASLFLVQGVNSSIDVNLKEREITVRVPGEMPVTAPVAIGSKENPTPEGNFFVTDLVIPTNANGAYGDFALGLSAHSETLSEFGGMDGQVGIHGTNDKSSIGRAVSHGCIRVPDSLLRLLRKVGLGSPVTIS